MKSVEVLNDFPFTFSREATFQVITHLLPSTAFTSYMISYLVLTFFFCLIDVDVVLTGLCEAGR